MNNQNKGTEEDTMMTNLNLTPEEVSVVQHALETTAVIWRRDPYYQYQIGASSFTHAADVADEIVRRLR